MNLRFTIALMAAFSALTLAGCGKNARSGKANPVSGPSSPEIVVTGLEGLKNQFSGTVSLRFALKDDQARGDVTFTCDVPNASLSGEGGDDLDCAAAALTLNLDQYVGQNLLTVTATNTASKQTITQTGVPFCAGPGCSKASAGTPAATDGAKAPEDTNKGVTGSEPRVPVTEGIPGAGVVGLPPGLPASGSVFNIPIGVPTVKLNIGRFWTMYLPPRYHLISTASNKTFEGPSTIEYAQVMNDMYTRSPFCTQSNNDNGLITTFPDGMGQLFSYCLRYYSLATAYHLAAGQDRSINHLEFSSPAAEPETYERYYFAAREVRDSESGTPPMERFESFCAGAYNRGTVPLTMVNNWWNDPIGPQPVAVQWCNTNMSGFGAGFDVWVAGFLFEEQDGASENAAQASIEMTFVVSAGGVGTSNPNVFLSGAAFRMRAMLLQTGLNAPFNIYVP